MPRSNGVFTLAGTRAVPGTTIRADELNVPLVDIAVGLTASLPRDGSAPMVGPINMNGRKITGLAAATASGDAARLDQIPTVSEWQESVAALTMSADRFPYATGESSAALAVLTAFARILLAAVAAGDARSVLGLGTLATKSAVAVGEITATGTANATTFLRGDGVWSGDLGWGQTWQSFVGARTAGTTYQNTTGMPLDISVTCSGSDRVLQSSVDGSTWVGLGKISTGGAELSLSVTIPPGHYYRVSGSTTIQYWAELR